MICYIMKTNYENNKTRKASTLGFFTIFYYQKQVVLRSSAMCEFHLEDIQS